MSFFTFLFKFLLFNLLFCFLWRVGFAIYFYDKTLLSPTLLQFLKSFYLGTKFDLRLILIIYTPLVLYYFTPFPLRFKRFTVVLWSIYGATVTALMMFAYALDWGHYSYLRSRVSATIINFLQDAGTSLHMVWESYPVITLFSGIFGIGFVCYYLLKSTLNKVVPNKVVPAPPGRPAQKNKFLLYLLIIIFWSAGIYGKFAFFPLRWSEAFFSPNSYLSAIALNPILYFVDTWKFRDVEYDLKKVKEYYPVMAKYCTQIPSVDSKLNPNLNSDLNFLRPLRVVIDNPLQNPIHNPKLAKELQAARKKSNQNQVNVVVIVLESMVAYKAGVFANPLNPTPGLDRLAKNGLFFKRFFVPVQMTARSIFSLTTGIPDVSTQKSSSRNPFVINQKTLLEQIPLKNKLYFIGGDSNWGNINGLFTNNISNLKIFQEGDFLGGRKHNDVWGISDYQLFIEANQILRNQSGSFLAIIQSAGFHRPYTIPEQPEDRGDFQLEKFNDKKKLEELTEYGFISQEEFNSLRFQDYSLDNFFKLANKEKYFDNTIFFIFGDHGLPVNGAKNVPSGEKLFDLENFHVPLVIYAPKFFSHQEFDNQASELDIFPTIASLFTGHPGPRQEQQQQKQMQKQMEYRGPGEDIFSMIFRGEKHRPLFFYYWYIQPPTYAMLENNLFLMTNSENDMGTLYDLSAANPGMGIGEKIPEKHKQLIDLTHAIYNTSKYLLYHNPK